MCLSTTGQKLNSLLELGGELQPIMAQHLEWLSNQAPILLRQGRI